MIETQEDLGTGKTSLAKRWTMEMENADKREADWRERARKVLDRYRVEGDYNKAKGSKFNILWSNTETIKPAIYSQTPIPDVRRRYSDMDDDQADRIATAIERSLSFAMDSYPFDREITKSRDDYLLPGRAISRVRYTPTIISVQKRKPVLQSDEKFMDGDKEIDASEVYLDAGGHYTLETTDELTYEQVSCEYVNWEDFRLSPAKQWSDVTWVAFRQLLTRDELVKYFGKIGNDVSLTVQSSDFSITDDKDENQSIFLKGECWEIWDKETRTVYWWSPGYKDNILKTIDDPLELEDFFPIPEPLYSIKSNDTMVPVPEFVMYQDQANELDNLTTRMEKLIDAIKAKAFYAAEQKEALDQAMRADEGMLIPVADWASFADKGGIEGMLSWMPVEQFGKVLSALYAKRNELIQTIYDITGISDIMRGSTDPRETKGAQQLKAQFGSRRMLPRARDFQYFIRDLLRLKAEIICKHFSVKTLYQMTGVQLNPQDMQIMRNDAMRAFKIDIETDSTIAPYDDEEKQNVSEFLQAMGSYAADVSALVQAGAIQPEAVGETLSWAAGKYKVSRDLQERLKQTGQVTNPQQIEAQKQQQQMQMQQQQQQAEQQQAAAAQQHQQALDMADQQHKQGLAQADMQIKVQNAALDRQIKMESHVQDMKIKLATAQQQIELANKKATAEKSRARAN